MAWRGMGWDGVVEYVTYRIVSCSMVACSCDEAEAEILIALLGKRVTFTYEAGIANLKP